VRRLLSFALVGLFAQLVDGALGMAYGITASTLLLSGGTGAAVASASVHLAEVGTTFVSGVSHWRFGNVRWRTVRLIAVPGAVGAFAGATVLGNLTAERVEPVVAGLLFALGVYVVARFAFGAMRRPVREDHVRGRFLAPLGAGAGFLDAVGGGGWGPVMTPSLMTVGRMEPRTAVGAASASEFLISSSASVGFLLALGRQGIDFGIVAALLIGGAIAAPLAAYAVRALPATVSGTLVGTLILVVNARTILLWAEVPGRARLAILVALAGAGAGLVHRAWRRRPVVGGASPAPVDPLLQVGALGADGGVVAVPGEHDRVGR
jgi:uncharacterized protein